MYSTSSTFKNVVLFSKYKYILGTYFYYCFQMKSILTIYYRVTLDNTETVTLGSENTNKRTITHVNYIPPGSLVLKFLTNLNLNIVILIPALNK